MSDIVLSSILTSFLTTIVILFLFVDFLKAMIESLVRCEVLEKTGKVEDAPRGIFKKKQKKEEEKFNPVGLTDEELHEKEVTSNEAKRTFF